MAGLANFIYCTFTYAGKAIAEMFELNLFTAFLQDGKHNIKKTKK
jgi:hypothetical protein